MPTTATGEVRRREGGRCPCTLPRRRWAEGQACPRVPHCRAKEWAEGRARPATAREVEAEAGAVPRVHTARRVVRPGAGRCRHTAAREGGQKKRGRAHVACRT